jgi:beta-lactamase class A
MDNKKHYKRRIALLLLIAVLITLTVFKGKLLFPNRLTGRIQSLMAQKKCKFSLVVKDLEFPYFKVAFNENAGFPATSIIKIPIMAVVFKAVDQGKVSLDQLIRIKKRDITPGSGQIKKMKLPVILTLAELMEIMIAYSDNTATNKIIDILGMEYLNDGFKDLGLQTTLLRRKMMDFSRRDKGVENYICSADIVFLLEKIYRQELISREYSRLMLDFLMNQAVNDRIPRYLPYKVRVAHKTGLERGVVHDAGIVFSEKGNYIICMFTRGIPAAQKAKKLIAEASLLTYNLYQ